MADERKSPVYVAYTTFKNTLRGLVQNGQIPARIDRSLLSSMSGSAQVLLMSALEQFSLLSNDGSPTQTLRNLANASESEWKRLMGEVVRKSYSAEQLRILAIGTPKQLRETFGDNGASVVDKACRFLVSAAEDTGLPIAPHIKNGKTSAASPRPRTPRRRHAVEGAQQSQHDAASTEPRDDRTVSFPIHIPGKASGHIIIPKTLTHEDWPMVEVMTKAVEAYLRNIAATNQSASPV